MCEQAVAQPLLTDSFDVDREFIMLILKRQPGMEDEIAKARIHACRCRTTSSMSKSKNTPQTQHQVATSMAHVDREAVVFAKRLSRFHFPQQKLPDLFDTGQALKCASCVVFSALVLSRLNSIDDLLCIICVSRFHFPSPASIMLSKRQQHSTRVRCVRIVRIAPFRFV